MAWTYEFNDAKDWSEFIIRDADGNEIITIRSNDFDHIEPRPEKPDLNMKVGYKEARRKYLEALQVWCHRRSPAAEQMARMICARCGD